MRNLKRVLSLALACVMVIGMMVMTTGAVDFDDAAEINYTEAVDVMSALGILEGYDGNFNPDGILTREQAAKIICYMLMSPANAEMLNSTSNFADVEADRWSAPYIAYCASLGIISGYNGNFEPAGELTGVAFAKLLLVALGYDAEIEGYVGNNWATNIGTDAIEAGINIAGVNMNEALTREQAAQMMLNTIEAPMVEYETKGSNISVNGAEINFGASKANFVTSTLAMEQRISDRQLTNSGVLTTAYTVEFGEKYFTKLMLDDEATDIYGRPARVWAYKTETIGEYTETDLLVKEYTSMVKYSDLFKLLGRNIVDAYDLEYYVDGADKTSTINVYKITKNENTKFGSIGTGVLTQVFVDHVEEEITVVSINTWLAVANADYSTATKKVSLDVFHGATGATTDAWTYAVSVDTIPTVVDLKQDDMMLVSIVDSKVVAINDVDVVEGVSVTSYSTDDDIVTEDTGYDLKSITADGVTYNRAEKGYYDAASLYDYALAQLKGSTYDIYLDPYGNMIGLEKVKGATNNVFVVGYEQGSSYLVSSVDQALVIWPDGTMEAVDVKDDKLTAGEKALLGVSGEENVNTWFTYTEKNGVYYLEAKVANQIVDNTTTELNIENTTVVQGATVAYGNKASTFITVKADKDVLAAGSIVKVTNVSTGIKNTNIEVKGDAALTNFDTVGTDNMIFAIYNNAGYITYAVVVGGNGGVTDNYLYLTSGITSESLVNGETIYTYKAINAEGEIVTVKSYVYEDEDGTNLAADGLYLAIYDADGIITEMNNKAQSATYQTLTHKDYGYMLSNDAVAKEVTSVGYTLYFDNGSDNDDYVLLDEDCVIYAWIGNGPGKGYVEFGSIKSALNELDAASVNGGFGAFVGNIAAYVNAHGIAEVLILGN